jgi:DNA polymerase I-like protein with 3'-5' exonuclease and polymerase domains
VPLIAAHEVDVASASAVIRNGLDAGLTFEIDEARRGLGRNDTLIYDFERAMQGPALEMMLRGFLVDINARETAVIQLREKRDQTERILSGIVRAIRGNYLATFPGSPKQLRELFYDSMSLKPIVRVINGVRTLPMNREALERLEKTNKFAAPIINAVLLYRDLSKSLQVLETEVDPDWRWRCSYNIGGTTTGRWSSSKSPFGTGSNFQNVSEDLRRVFIPDPGFKLYGVDKAQSEARDVGWFCGVVLGDWSYLDACESGDLHTYVTRLLHPEWTWTGVLRDDRKIAERRAYRFLTHRDLSKRLGHGTNYIGTAREMARQLRLPVELVEDFQVRYFAAFPCIPLMHKWIASALQRDRYLVNSFGRRRDFFDRPDDYETVKSAVAYMFQSATGDAVNLGLYRLWRGLRGRIQILSQLHDAIYFQAPIPANGAAEQTLLRDVLRLVEVRQTDRRSGRSMTIPGEVVGGFNWGHRFRLRADGTVEERNPNGLDSIKVAA